MALFGFFALVLVSVYWVNRAVSLFDKLIGDGQTAWVVMEFTLLTLPNAIRLVLPVAAFAATVYAVTRLASDSELVVMQATGTSPWRLARPVVAFGLIIGLMMTALVHVLVPYSRVALAERSAAVSSDITARFFTEGTFEHPVDGITMYIRQITDRGEMLDMFLSDERSAQNHTVYTASKALIVASDTGPKLVMFDGQAQTLRLADHSLALTRFSSFTYDLAQLMGGGGDGVPDWNMIPSWRLVAPGPNLLKSMNSTRGAALLELNDRVAQTLLAPVAALVGFAALMLGGFSRFGVTRQVVIAVFGLIVLQALDNVATSSVSRHPGLWPMAYLPIAVGLAGSAFMLYWASRPRCIRRRERASE